MELWLFVADYNFSVGLVF